MVYFFNLNQLGCLSAGSKAQVTFHSSRVQVAVLSINYQTTQIPLDLMEHFFFKRLGLGDTFNVIHISVSLSPVLSVSRLSLNKHLANGHLELDPAYRYSHYWTLHNREICQRRTLRARPKGVCLGESLLWLLWQVVCYMSYIFTVINPGWRPNEASNISALDSLSYKWLSVNFLKGERKKQFINYGPSCFFLATICK